MKRSLLSSTLLIICFLAVNTETSACDQFTAFTVTKGSGCTANIAWSYTECALGNYYILYSTDGSNFYPIGQVAATGGGGGTYNYPFTDNNVIVNSSGKTFYEIRYISPSNLSVYSSIVPLTASGCSTNMASRCASLPALTMNGADAICFNTTQTYSLSSSYLTTWTISGGSNLVSSNVGTSYSSVGITNGTNTGRISLNANIYGCKDISKAIAIGPSIVGYYTITANSWGNPGYQFDLPGGASVLLAKNDNATFICHVTNSNLSNINWTYSGYTPTSYTIGNGGLGLTFAMNVPSTSYASNTTNWNITANSTCGNVNLTIPFNVTANGGFSVQKGNFNPNSNETKDVSNLVNEENRLAIFPNPSKGSVLNVVVLTKSSLVKLKIIGMSGNILRQENKTFVNKGIQFFDVDIHNYPAGSYILEVSDGKLRSTKRFVKASN